MIDDAIKGLSFVRAAWPGEDQFSCEIDCGISWLFGCWSERCDWEAMTRGWNDLESTVMSCYPVVRDVYNGLVEGGATWVRLSGTGATVFAFFASPPDTSGLTGKLPFGSRVVQTETLGRSALDKLRVVR